MGINLVTHSLHIKFEILTSSKSREIVFKNQVISQLSTRQTFNTPEPLLF